jgi:hypothetical protein
MSELKTVLEANHIKGSEEAIQEFLNRNEWIYPSDRVDSLLEKLNSQQLYSIFNSQHHLQASTKLFAFLAKMKRKVSVVYGHKAQGKTQFLFFVFKLLQAMGEKVIFLDKTALTLKSSKKVDISSSKFCGNLWKDEFLKISDINVQSSLETFYKDALPESFGEFFFAVLQYIRSSGNVIWIVVDEAVSFENFPIDLPEEQNLGPFNWILTGSAGIGSWVSKRHLEKRVFDLPLFTAKECFEFAQKLCSSLGLDLGSRIDGIPLTGVEDWLEERFGGVIGYVTEMLLEISKGNLLSQYMNDLSGRMNKVIGNAANLKHISNGQLSKDWLNEIRSSRNNWDCLRDAGLCGSSAPRGIIFSMILEWLCIFSPEENALSLVTLFRSKFSGDAGLDGCLLELEEKLKLKACNSIKASLLTLVDEKWTVEESIDLPPKGAMLNFLKYEESDFKLEKTAESAAMSSWFLIQLPSGFDLIDVVLVDISQSPSVYGIQITRSVKPFAKHHTFDTCLPKSRERLEKLRSTILKHFQLHDSTELFYVMLAPYCKNDEFKPPGAHLSDYYFSPTKIIIEYDPSTLGKRVSDPVVSARLPPLKKKCCKCRSGECTNCQCFKKRCLAEDKHEEN